MNFFQNFIYFDFFNHFFCIFGSGGTFFAFRRKESVWRKGKFADKEFSRNIMIEIESVHDWIRMKEREKVYM